MKRDMDLCRDILLSIELLETSSGWIDIEIVGRTPSEITYHVKLLDEAGLIEAEDLSTLDGIEWKPRRLTWTGHEFLDSARNEGFWGRAKEITLAKTGALSFELLKTVLTEIGKTAIKGFV